MKNLVLLYWITDLIFKNKLCMSRKFLILDLIVNYQHFKLNYEMMWHDINVCFKRLYWDYVVFKINFKA